MRPLTNPFMNHRAIIGIGLAVCASQQALAVTERNWNELLQNPPFPASIAAETIAPDALEFRGWVVEDGQIFFSVFNIATQKSRWITRDESAASSGSMVVNDYDLDRGIVSVSYEGKVYPLQLRRSQIALVAAAAGANPETGEENIAMIGNDEQKRLAKIAVEIRRRRAQRLQTLQAAANLAVDDQPTESAPPENER